MSTAAIVTRGLGTPYGSPSLVVTHGFLAGPELMRYVAVYGAVTLEPWITVDALTVSQILEVGPITIDPL